MSTVPLFETEWWVWSYIRLDSEPYRMSLITNRRRVSLSLRLPFSATKGWRARLKTQKVSLSIRRIANIEYSVCVFQRDKERGVIVRRSWEMPVSVSHVLLSSWYKNKTLLTDSFESRGTLLTWRGMSAHDLTEILMSLFPWLNGSGLPQPQRFQNERRKGFQCIKYESRIAPGTQRHRWLLLSYVNHRVKERWADCSRGSMLQFKLPIIICRNRIMWHRHIWELNPKTAWLSTHTRPLHRITLALRTKCRRGFVCWNTGFN